MPNLIKNILVIFKNLAKQLCRIL